MAKLGNLKGSLRVENPTFNHGDFVWSPRVAEYVHLPVIDLLDPPFIYKNMNIIVPLWKQVKFSAFVFRSMGRVIILQSALISLQIIGLSFSNAKFCC